MLSYAPTCRQDLTPTPNPCPQASRVSSTPTPPKLPRPPALCRWTPSFARTSPLKRHDCQLLNIPTFEATLEHSAWYFVMAAIFCHKIDWRTWGEVCSFEGPNAANSMKWCCAVATYCVLHLCVRTWNFYQRNISIRNRVDRNWNNPVLRPSRATIRWSVLTPC